MVFLPGWGFKATIWENIMHALSANFLVSLVDFPILTTQDIASPNQLDHIIYQLHEKISSQSIIIAWSFSCLLAIHLCNQYKQNYRQLILINGTPRFLADHEWPGISLKEKNNFISTFIYHKNDLVDHFIKLVMYPSTNLVHKKQILNYLLLDNELDHDNLQYYLNLLFKLDLRQEYSQLSLPIAHIIGNKDIIVSSKLIQPIQQLNSSAKIHVFPQAGHIPFLTHHDIFIKKNVRDNK